MRMRPIALMMPMKIILCGLKNFSRVPLVMGQIRSWEMVHQQTALGDQPPRMDLKKKVDDFEVSLSKDFKGEGPKDDSDTTTNDISHTVCGALTAWFQQVHSRAEIQEALKECKRPLNATALKAVQINQEVKKINDTC